VTRGQLPQRAGLPGLNGGGAAAAVPPRKMRLTRWLAVTVILAMCVEGVSLRDKSLCQILRSTVFAWEYDVFHKFYLGSCSWDAPPFAQN